MTATDDLFNAPLDPQFKTALVLSGGGARGAYQAGVLKALAELYPADAPIPFEILSGTSAGGLNAAALAAGAPNFKQAVNNTCQLWSQLDISDVYHTGVWDIIKSAGYLFLSVLPFTRGNQAVALLNSAPLWHFIRRRIAISNISTHVQSGLLHAFGITVSSYASSGSITFFEADHNVKNWSTGKRYGIRQKLMTEHFVASAAIPGILPAVKIGDHYYGDGALRQVAPLSASLHMGARRLMVIGVSHNPDSKQVAIPSAASRNTPSLAGILGHVFNSAFLDAFDSDIENLIRINHLLAIAENNDPHISTDNFKKIDLLAINPSTPLDEIAERHIDTLPKTVRVLFNLLGASQKSGGSSMASYLMFDGRFCSDLIDLGYRDGIANKAMMMEFFRLAK